ncbi:hypothetical protein [Paenibacillus sp. NAIST15-1]|uniref:hypothetical protein n=1 Tax=Paenibacillus sp. NAIST15-1 TaxID=1605994 RepID=UPI00086CA82A|nr:hypothetical protein [Paenibacillus sp. NAIST15-1]GAV15277.1 hypothetical protein PBN151_5256 [Paenibacillus sp. NAIST15-1]
MNSIEKKIEGLFRELQFEKEILNNTNVFVRDGKYCRVTFIKTLESYVIEYADSYDEAEKNLFEDGDLFPVSLGEDELINRMRYEIADS